MATIVAISGWKRSGKDTLAEYLIKSYGAKRLAFADPLKDECAKQYGVPRAHFDDPAFKEKPILTMPVTPKDGFSKMIAEFMFKEFRSADGLQPVGFRPADRGFQGVIERPPARGRLLEPIYWTPRALAILEGSTKRATDPNYWVKKAVEGAGEGLFVISDLRYQSEVTGLESAVGAQSVITIRINRFASSPSNDPSEYDLDHYEHFDAAIENTGTIEELYLAWDAILAAHGFVEKLKLPEQVVQ